MDVSSLEPKLQELIQAAVKVKENAYCPYSKFRVGAAVLCDDGTVFAGCNMENASYGLSVCAERNAMAKAVSEGHRKIKAVAVSCDVKGSPQAPCGVCRQVLAEFNLDVDLYLVLPDNTFHKVSLPDLLPMAFTPQSLEEERI